MPGIVATMRNEIIELGGEVRFGTRLVDWEFQEGAISSVSLEQVEKGTIYAQPVSKVVLACGHSARDVFDLCKRSDFAMEQKPFFGRRSHRASSKGYQQRAMGKSCKSPCTWSGRI